MSADFDMDSYIIFFVYRRTGSPQCTTSSYDRFNHEDNQILAFGGTKGVETKRSRARAARPSAAKNNVGTRSTSVVVRTVTPADAQAYLDLRSVAEKEHPEFVGFMAERELTAGLSGIQKLLDAYRRDGTEVFGAFVGDELIGAVGVSRRLTSKYRHSALLWGMYVALTMRGNGVARRLMNAIKTWAAQQADIRRLVLQVTATNVRARLFYQRYNFELFGIEPEALFASGRFYDVHYMQLRLTVDAPQIET